MEIVGHCTGAGVTEIKRGLLVEGMSWIGVWDIHIGERSPVEEWSVHVSDIVQNHSFTCIITDAEEPLLPFHDMTSLTDGSELERCTLRLDDLQRLQILSNVMSLMNILVSGFVLVWLEITSFVASTSWQMINANDFVLIAVEYW